MVLLQTDGQKAMHMSPQFKSTGVLIKLGISAVLSFLQDWDPYRGSITFPKPIITICNETSDIKLKEKKSL